MGKGLVWACLLAMGMSQAAFGVSCPSGAGWSDKITNVKSFGAKGDGVTDDTGILQGVFTAAQNGDKILFTKGNYLITSKLQIRNKKVCVVFDDDALLVDKKIPVPGSFHVFDTGIVATYTYQNGELTNLNTGEMLLLHKADDSVLLNIRGQGAQTHLSPSWNNTKYSDHNLDSTWPVFLKIEHSKRVTLTGLSISGRTKGLWLYFTSDSQISNVNVQGYLFDPKNRPVHEHARLAVGVLLSRSHNNVLHNIRSQDHGNISTYGGNSSFNLYKNCRGERLFENGIYGSSGFHNIVVACKVNNVYDNVGIKMRGIGDIAIRNEVTNIANAGMGLTGGGQPFSANDRYNGRGSVMLENKVSNVVRNGLYASSYDGYSTRNNVIAYNSVVNVATQPDANTRFAFRLDSGEGQRVVKNSILDFGSATDNTTLVYAIGSKNLGRSNGFVVKDNLLRGLNKDCGILGARYSESLISGNTFVNLACGIEFESTLDSFIPNSRFRTVGTKYNDKDGSCFSDASGIVCGTGGQFGPSKPEFEPIFAPDPVNGIEAGNQIRFGVGKQQAFFLKDGRPSDRQTFAIVSCKKGTFDFTGDVSALTFRYGGPGETVMIFQGTVAQINAAMRTLVYTAKPTFTGNDIVMFTIVDKLTGVTPTYSAETYVAARAERGYSSETGYMEINPGTN